MRLSAVVLARWLQGVSQCLPEDWEERVAETVIPAEEREDLERRERELKARIERATRLHLEGDISYERFAEEKQRAQAGLANLRAARMEATIAAKEAIEDIAHRWEAMDRVKQKWAPARSRCRSPGRRHEADRRQANSTSVPLGGDSLSERGRRESVFSDEVAVLTPDAEPHQTVLD